MIKLQQIIVSDLGKRSQIFRHELAFICLGNAVLQFLITVIGQKQAEDLYRGFGAAMSGLSNWSLYLLSSNTEFERCFGRTADKKRKLYNGMIKCDLFMYYK